jgi:hypothetical protein
MDRCNTAERCSRPESIVPQSARFHQFHKLHELPERSPQYITDRPVRDFVLQRVFALPWQQGTDAAELCAAERRNCGAAQQNSVLTMAARLPSDFVHRLFMPLQRAILVHRSEKCHEFRNPAEDLQKITIMSLRLLSELRNIVPELFYLIRSLRCRAATAFHAVVSA